MGLTVDPVGLTVDPVLSLLVGALGAAVLGLIGAAIQARREHSKWLREKRYDAHLAFLVLVDRHTTNAKLQEGPKTKAAVKEALEGLNESVSAISLLGPESLLTAARLLRDAGGEYIGNEKEPAGFAAVRARYITTSRKSLGVSSR